MVLLRNVSPLGEIDLPLIRREGDNGEYGPGVNDDGDPIEVRTAVHGSGCLERGEVFEVDDETAAHLLEQVGNFELAEPVDPASAPGGEIATGDPVVVGELGPEVVMPLNPSAPDDAKEAEQA